MSKYYVIFPALYTMCITMSILCKFIGNIGESYAEKYLKGCGYTIIDRQHRVSFVEIDILAKKQSVLYLFEVKSVSHRNIINSPFHPVRRVSRKKIQNMSVFADHYLNEHPHYAAVSMGIIIVVLADELKKPLIEIVWI